MFDPEKLLNKVISEMTGSKSKKSKKKYKKKYKKKKGNGFADSMKSNLTSGKGLITAIGLGVGAYAILRSKNSQPATGSYQQGAGTPGQVTSVTSQSTVPPVPPPIPGDEVVPAEQVEASTPTPQLSDPEKMDLALKLVQVMIAAAWADGKMDGDEEKQILGRLQGQGLDSEEKKYLLTELHNPRSIEELCAGVTDPMIGQTMYSLAVSALVIDTPEERAWLNDLAAHLLLSKEMQAFIEEDG